MNTLSVEQARPEDALEVARFCQPIYEAIYPNDKYGLRPEHFAPWVFETEDSLKYFREIMQCTDSQAAYIARLGGKIVGTICVTEFVDHYEPRCFYVDTELQGQGIGSILWKKAMEFCTKALPIVVEVAETSEKTRAMYRKWGFEVAPERGVNMRHWAEWPEGVENGYVFMTKHLS